MPTVYPEGPVAADIFPFAGPAHLAYPGSVNIQLEPGKVLPAFDFGEMVNSGDVLHYFSNVIETRAPNESSAGTGGGPRVYAAANATVYRFENGVRTVDVTFASAIQDLQIVDNGSGTAVLMAVFGDGAVNGNATRNLGTDTAPWTTNTGASFLTAFGIRTAGPDLYGVTGSAAIGRANLGERKVAKCPVGTAPITAANWSVGEVTSTHWPITGMAAYKEKICIACGDGFYVRDNQDKLFKNLMERERFLPHASNGKVCESGENCVWYSTHDGGLFRFDGYDMHDETPFRDIERPRDASLGRVSALCDLGAFIDIFTEGCHTWLDGQQSSTQIGLRVFKEDGGVITELTTNVTDGSIATGGAVGSLGAVTQDYLVFGTDEPVEGFILVVTRFPNSAVQSFTAPQTLNGAAVWTSLGTVVDASILGTAGVSLALVGFPASASRAVLRWTALNGRALAQKDTYNGIAGKYWYRFATATVTGFTATAQIDETGTIPGRAGLPSGDFLPASQNFTPGINAGVFGHILRGYRRGSRIEWHDMYVLPTHGVWKLSRHSGPSGSMTNGGPPLLAWGRFGQYIIADAALHDPSRQPYPRLTQQTTTEPVPTLRISRLRFGDPFKLTSLRRVAVFGKHFQRSDAVHLYVQVDEHPPVDCGRLWGMPAFFDLSKLVPEGEEFDIQLQIRDAAQTNPSAPYITRIRVEYEDTGQLYEFPQHGNVRSPEAA